MDKRTRNNSERGVATVEFALTASIAFMMLVAVVSGGHLFWTHNALVEATRRGARYAANQCKPTVTTCPNYSTTVERVKNVVLYNSPIAGTTPFVDGLQASNITVTFSNDPVTFSNNFGVATGTVSVRIDNYDYTFKVGGIVIHMPPYQTTVAGENAGFIPPDK